MRVAVFFVFLYSLLLSGHDCIYTDTCHNGDGYTTAQYIEKTQKAKFANTNQEYAVVNDTDPDQQREYLVTDNVEDENTNNLLSRKYKLLTGCYLALSCPFILSYLHSRFKVSQPFCNHLSYKYITQRVLRI